MDATRRSTLARLGTDRLLIVASLGLLVAVAWAYLLFLDAAMARGDMSLMGMEAIAADAPMGATIAPWSGATFSLMFLMWCIMMVGMMVPSALPMILLHARVQRRYRPQRSAVRFSLLFVGGYVASWAVFSAAATTGQWSLTASGLLSPMSMSTTAAVGAALFAVAGLYQFSPLKDVCLRHCRSPAEFLATHQRPGLAGAFVTGAHHGLYCVGCCWLLMALLFAGGVMNLIWVAALAILVLLEKLVPQGQWLARGSGIAMLGISAVLLASA